jgi:phosphohistidine swiveling domain-containing protein
MPPPPTIVPLPDNFEIEWATPEQVHMPWQQDRQHVPNPITPMSQWFADNGFAVGFNKALQSFESPLAATTARFNSYYYMAIAPNIPPEQVPAALEKMTATMEPRIDTFEHQWEDKWLPELKSIWAGCEAFDLDASSNDELIAQAHNILDIAKRIWEIHMLMLLPAFAATSNFQDLYAELVGSESDVDAYRLLQGLPNMSVEAGTKLWDLTQRAKADAAVATTIAGTAASDLHGALKANAATAWFAEAIDDYVSVYGRRSDTVQELSDPSWIEDPSPAYTSIRGYAQQIGTPSELHARLVSERDEAIAHAHSKIASQPEGVKREFDRLMKAGQAASRLQEDHNFWIDQRGLHETRQVCLAIGRRLVKAGALEDAEDVLLLELPEAIELLRNGGDGKARAAERRAEMDHYAKIPAPPLVGTDYGPPPDAPITRAIFRFFGGPPPVSDVPNEVGGNAGSAGTVTGTARVIINLSEAGRLQPGDILVTATTSPPWTPLFAIAGGIVTDTGGILSHCAVVAREYAIPAVVGTGMATAVIQDGTTITVDGSSGKVTIGG